MRKISVTKEKLTEMVVSGARRVLKELGYPDGKMGISVRDLCENVLHEFSSDELGDVFDDFVKSLDDSRMVMFNVSYGGEDVMLADPELEEEVSSFVNGSQELAGESKEAIEEAAAEYLKNNEPEEEDFGPNPDDEYERMRDERARRNGLY